jgi:hypothetical protein
MNSANNVISVPGGCSNPYQHTWQIGLNINHWWPVQGVDSSGVLCGNDGKLWAYANDRFYAYLHQEGTYPPLIESGIYHFSVEIQGASFLDVQFWLGVGNAKPVRISPTSGSEGALYVDFNYSLQLHTNYYFQIAVNANGPAGDYYIGNCAPGCRDTMVVGFPAGCYFYSWREDNTVLDLSKGGNWAQDVVTWAGGTPPPTPTPGPPGPPQTVTPGAVKLSGMVNVQEYQPGID